MGLSGIARASGATEVVTASSEVSASATEVCDVQYMHMFKNIPAFSCNEAKVNTNKFL